MPSADPASGPLRVERPADGVVLLRLSLPERRNAMTEQMTAEWTAAVAAIAADRSVRAVVVTGEGTVFCSGGDLSWIEEGGSEVDALRTKMLAFYRAWLSVRELEVPVLAAVNGPAIGAGLCLALACDLRYAAPTARFGAPFTALGMHPGMAASYLLPEAVGLPRAREMFYTGKIVGADEAATIGLINGVLPAETLVDEVVATAVKVAVHGPGSRTADQAGPAARSTVVRGGLGVGGAGPADHHVDRRHARGASRPGRAPAAALRGPLNELFSTEKG